MEPTSYALWDAETGNIIGAFSTEEEGLHVVRVVLNGDDQHSAHDLLLTCRDSDGVAQVIAQGRLLAEMARRQRTTISSTATIATNP